MNEGQVIRQSYRGLSPADFKSLEQADLWRQAGDSSIPRAEKISYVVFAVFILGGHFLGAFSPTTIWFFLFLGFIGFSSSRHYRQQSQIGALRELLRRAVEKSHS